MAVKVPCAALPLTRPFVRPAPVTRGLSVRRCPAACFEELRRLAWHYLDLCPPNAGSRSERLLQDLANESLAVLDAAEEEMQSDAADLRRRLQHLEGYAQDWTRSFPDLGETPSGVLRRLREAEAGVRRLTEELRAEREKGRRRAERSDAQYAALAAAYRTNPGPQQRPAAQGRERESPAELRHATAGNAGRPLKAGAEGSPDAAPGGGSVGATSTGTACPKQKPVSAPQEAPLVQPRLSGEVRCHRVKPRATAMAAALRERVPNKVVPATGWRVAVPMDKIRPGGLSSTQPAPARGGRRRSSSMPVREGRGEERRGGEGCGGAPTIEAGVLSVAGFRSGPPAAARSAGRSPMGSSPARIRITPYATVETAFEALDRLRREALLTVR
eukprot:Hpha_TRINITY_DN12272_c0_g1::TRINITY_DN12272_c0_g1_i4::g.17043::m.17043